ncbi:hypothetical protein SAMN05421659_10150 [[Clostridium] fimetarium]|uniref:Uncharacterized protein n=2 Tax=[Clostridium] fimetarium TaxID=99656 RepID=A0A1I0M295_9FIRM|nr:hypothetical protein SAMN05421659_10150 [[Clostridium] fimetarium]
MDNEKNIDDIVSMIDQFMAGNGGHLNVSVADASNIDLQKTTQTTNSLECAAGNLACNVPTLHNGLDGEE